MQKRNLKGNLQRSKRSLKTIRLSEDEVIKLKTLKTRRMVTDSFISSCIKNTCFESKAWKMFLKLPRSYNLLRSSRISNSKLKTIKCKRGGQDTMEHGLPVDHGNSLCKISQDCHPQLALAGEGLPAAIGLECLEKHVLSCEEYVKDSYPSLILHLGND
ncbi:hypothetical protein M9H77_26924 [Catharanthus roseus]|uniref:Uncharacterized protein n=1 Tax=Catharanthus roseus TaxID=4058 RepID=A0ACC0AC18_CATRO|nr:hypothetical protein M9H77_26924 [Catharanthus roseus]